jgi:hypothetical protein
MRILVKSDYILEIEFRIATASVEWVWPVRKSLVLLSSLR